MSTNPSGTQSRLIVYSNTQAPDYAPPRPAECQPNPPPAIEPNTLSTHPTPNIPAAAAPLDASTPRLDTGGVIHSNPEQQLDGSPLPKQPLQQLGNDPPLQIDDFSRAFHGYSEDNSPAFGDRLTDSLHCPSSDIPTAPKSSVTRGQPSEGRGTVCGPLLSKSRKQVASFDQGHVNALTSTSGRRHRRSARAWRMNPRRPARVRAKRGVQSATENRRLSFSSTETYEISNTDAGTHYSPIPSDIEDNSGLPSPTTLVSQVDATGCNNGDHHQDPSELEKVQVPDIGPVSIYLTKLTIGFRLPINYIWYQQDHLWRRADDLNKSISVNDSVKDFKISAISQISVFITSIEKDITLVRSSWDNNAFITTLGDVVIWVSATEVSVMIGEIEERTEEMQDNFRELYFRQPQEGLRPLGFVIPC